jgi:hypothetical protein
VFRTKDLLGRRVPLAFDASEQHEAAEITNSISTEDENLPRSSHIRTITTTSDMRKAIGSIRKTEPSTSSALKGYWHALACTSGQASDKTSFCIARSI